MPGRVHGCGSIDNERFEKLLELQFPAVSQKLTDLERGLLHLEMAALARATRAAIDGGDTAEVHAHLKFIDELFCDSASDLENAIYVSYLENVFLGQQSERYLEARAAMSQTLRVALLELEDHWAKISESARNRPKERA